MIITEQTHPTLFKACEIISHDRGSGSGHTNYALPDAFDNDLDLFEKALATLTQEELEDLCIGEMSDAYRIANRSPALYKTHLFLDAFFQDFELENSDEQLS